MFEFLVVVCLSVVPGPAADGMSAEAIRLDGPTRAGSAHRNVSNEGWSAVCRTEAPLIRLPPSEMPVITMKAAKSGGANTAVPPLPPPLMGAACPRRRLRVYVYARYSTEQQTDQSLADQEAKCRRYIQGLGLDDAEIVVIAEAAITGELAHRPGIDKLWGVIESGGCDLIVTEELSTFLNPRPLAV